MAEVKRTKMKWLFAIAFCFIFFQHGNAQTKNIPGFLVNNLLEYTVDRVTYRSGDSIFTPNGMRFQIDLVQSFDTKNAIRVFAYTTSKDYVLLEKFYVAKIAPRQYRNYRVVDTNQMQQAMIESLQKKIYLLEHQQSEAGFMMKRFTKIENTGYALEVLGLAALVGGILVSSENQNFANALYTTSGLLITSGFILHIIAPSQIRKSGSSLSQGIGIL